MNAFIVNGRTHARETIAYIFVTGGRRKNYEKVAFGEMVEKSAGGVADRFFPLDA